jgi:hypothetical protein
MKTFLTGLRKPTAQEKERGAEVVFIRHDSDGKEFVILGSTCHESWEQWNQPTEILAENVDDIQEWRNRIL